MRSIAFLTERDITGITLCSIIYLIDVIYQVLLCFLLTKLLVKLCDDIRLNYKTSYLLIPIQLTVSHLKLPYIIFLNFLTFDIN